MVGPVDAVKAVHNAFRRDIDAIDAAALDAARGIPGRTATLERFRFFNEMLVWHAHGEELAIFPALEAVAPLIAEAYVQDHHGLDVAFDVLNAAVAAHDTLQTARASAVFKFHLHLHLDKEDAHVYRLIRERVSLPDQGKALGAMSSVAPQERFPEVVTWMYSLMSMDDSETMTRVWQMVMPAPVFAGAKQLIQRAMGNDWAELARRIPTLL